MTMISNAGRPGPNTEIENSPQQPYDQRTQDDNHAASADNGIVIPQPQPDPPRVPPPGPIDPPDGPWDPPLGPPPNPDDVASAGRAAMLSALAPKKTV